MAAAATAAGAQAAAAHPGVRAGAVRGAGGGADPPAGSAGAGGL